MAAFSRDLKLGDDRRDANGPKSRSFGALARDSTPDGKSNTNALSINYGNGMADWGPNSIWSNGSIGAGLTSRATTRESSRDGSKPADHEDHVKTNSRTTGSLGADNPWNRVGDWKSSTCRTMSQADQAGRGQPQHRGISNTAAAGFSGSSMASRLPAISLCTTSLGAASGHRSVNSNAATARGYEPAPTVYTKHDRHQDPNSKAYRDSGTVGPWTSVSPTDARRPFPPSSRDASQPMSRNGSQQYDTPTEERPPSFTRPDYSRQRSAQNGSRALSMSSQHAMPYNSSIDANVDQLPMQFGGLSMNGDSRPQTSYRSSETTFSPPWSAEISSFTRSSMSGPRPSFGAMDDADDADADPNYAAYQNALSPIATNFAAQTHGGLYPPTPISADFRPGEPFANGHVSSRGSNTVTAPKTLQDWQNMSGGMAAMQLSRPAPSVADSQHLMTPQVQQLLAAQFRPQFHPMFNAYGIPGTFQFNPYLPMMPMAYSETDQNGAVQEITNGENIQSALLFEFKNQNKSKRYELQDIYDHIAEFSGDQHGSRFIQTKLETANSDEKKRVFSEIEPNAIQLMTDVFGNYVIQKFFEHGDQTHKRILAAKMKGQVLALTNQMYGCRVVQKALDHVLVEQQAALVRELDGHVLRCVKDQNGNHVIQKAIERCPSHTIGFIINSFLNSVQQLSVNSYGCRVIQRCLEHCDKPAKAMIMGELMDGIQGMVTDQYGNYVVQHVVERDEGDGRHHVLNIVMKHLEMYSKHKFASNVVEKCLERADELWRKTVVSKLCNEERRGPDGESVLVGMIKDNYGNYVIQKLLDTLGPPEFFHFLESLHPAVVQAKRTGCGKQIQSVERKMERFSRSGGGARHCLPLPQAQAQAQTMMAPPTGPGAASFTPAPPPSFHHSFAMQPAFASKFASAGTTPPPLTADQSRQGSSGLTSSNGDAVEGAHAHAHCRPGLRKGVDDGYLR